MAAFYSSRKGREDDFTVVTQPQTAELPIPIQDVYKFKIVPQAKIFNDYVDSDLQDANLTPSLKSGLKKGYASTSKQTL